MTLQEPIVVPIALSQTRSATITLPWFVQRTEYNPAQANYKPLVNGLKTFAALYDAIEAANHSIDHVCWGFSAIDAYRWVRWFTSETSVRRTACASSTPT